jgi:hypothetical protein
MRLAGMVMMAAVTACGGAADEPGPDAEPGPFQLRESLVADGLGDVGEIAVDGDAIYVVRGNSEVLRVSHDGATVDVVSPAPGFPFALHPHAGDVYWVELGTEPDFEDGSIMRLRSGAATAEVAVADRVFPADVVVFDDTLFWVESGAIWQAWLDGSNAGSWFESETAKNAIAVKATHVMWSQPGPDAIVARDRISGETTVIEGASTPDHLIAIGDELYWVDGNSDERILRSRNLGPAVTIASQQHAAAWAGLASDGAYVYWTYQARTIQRAPIAGDGEPAEVWATGGYVDGLATLGRELYWTDSASGSIYRAATER